jgi:hypothetical protein
MKAAVRGVRGILLMLFRLTITGAVLAEDNLTSQDIAQAPNLAQ